MIKIGILTFSNSYNYGAALQAYALKTVIDELGYEASIIDYTIKSDFRQYNPAIFSSGLIFAPVKIKDYFENVKRKKAFSAFRERYFNLSDKQYFDSDELTELNEMYDAFVVGSDQVWNVNITHKIPEDFLLSFVSDTKIKIAYAPSIGNGEDTFLENRNIFSDRLSRFDFISCREESGADLIGKITGQSIPVVLDPTLLLEPEKYIALDSEYEGRKDKYIFVYTFGKIRKDYILKLAKEKQLKIKYFSNFFHPGLCEKISHSGPSEFINLIRNAEYVITNSFHGTVFSILMKKQFCVYNLSANDLRIQPMLNRFGLNSRIYTAGFNIDNQINYRNIFDKINIERKSSIAFLKDALENKMR